MPKFTQKPNPDDRQNVMQILRAPTKGSIKAIATSPEICGCNTHWYGGRTVPCEFPDCDPCLANVTWRWHGYLSALDPNTNQHFLFEFTAQAHDAFETYLKLHDNLRGCVFRTSRAGGRPNGRVQIHTRETTMPLSQLPAAPDIGAILCHVWNVEPDRRVEAVYSSEHNGDRLRRTTQIKSIK